MRFSLILLFFTSLLYTYTSAQQVADTLRLADVEVQASRIYVADRYQPVSITRIDSARIQFHSAGNISDLLEAYAPVYVRTNGPGGLSTLSQRGYSSSQTQVLWNGFQLNHAMLGLTDLSLIPSFAVQNLSIASGNGNTSFGDKGGGTVAIQLRKPENKIGLSQSLGSFGQRITESYAGVKAGNWLIGAITGLENSDNDFNYTIREFSNEAGGFTELKKERINNELNSKTGIISAEWRKRNKQFSSVIWIHDMKNEIPGGINSLTPEAYQEDRFLRWMSSYKASIQDHRFTAKVFFNRQQLDFINPSSNINSLSTSSSLIADAEVRSSVLPHLQLVSAVQFGQSWVEASDYSGSPQRSQLTVQTNPVWHALNPVHIYGGFRFDYYTDFKEAYSANIGTNIEIFRDLLFLKGQLSRNFVAPTFNDLYWPELGDPNLEPETNLKYEMGLLLLKNWENVENEFEFTVYDGRVEDGIRWLPGENGLTRPQNLEELRLWGFEVKENITLTSGDFRANVQGMLLHSLAELQARRFEGDQAVGKQLRYTPKWQVKSSAFIGWKELSTVFSYNFTDERFSSADHSSPFDPMPSYQRANWSSSYNFTVEKFRFTSQFSIQNLFDEDYSVIRDYPMPGRSYQFKLTIQYSFK